MKDVPGFANHRTTFPPTPLLSHSVLPSLPPFVPVPYRNVSIFSAFFSVLHLIPFVRIQAYCGAPIKIPHFLPLLSYVAQRAATSRYALLVPIVIEIGVRYRYVLAQDYPLCVHTHNAEQSQAFPTSPSPDVEIHSDNFQVCVSLCSLCMHMPLT